MTRGDELVELHGNVITLAMIVGLIALVIVVAVVEYRTSLRAESKRTGTAMRIFLTHTAGPWCSVGTEVTHRGTRYRVTRVRQLEPTILIDGSRQPCAEVWGIPL